TVQFVLKQLMEQHTTRRLAAIFAPGYWAGLRISAIATLRVDQCQVNQRAGSITLPSKTSAGLSTRTPGTLFETHSPPLASTPTGPHHLYSGHLSPASLCPSETGSVRFFPERRTRSLWPLDTNPRLIRSELLFIKRCSDGLQVE